MVLGIQEEVSHQTGEGLWGERLMNRDWDRGTVMFGLQGYLAHKKLPPLPPKAHRNAQA